MGNDIVDIIHRITYDVQDRELDKAVKTVQGNITGIENLTKRQIRLVEQYNKTGVQDVKTREKINRMIEQNTKSLNYHKKCLEDNLVSNKSLNRALNQEIGLVGNLENRLKILTQARKRATSQTEIDRYNKLISNTKTQISVTNPNQNINKNGGLLSGLGLSSGASAVSRLIPAIGGAIGIAQLGTQIKDVTQKFESYRTTLKNTFQSSIRANEEFAKIKDFAEKTPFGVEETTAAFIKLVNRGFVPTIEELTNIGDLTASQGKSFDQLVEAILDAQTGEFERLKEFGIRAKTVGDTVTLSFKGVEKQVKKTDEKALRNAVISFGKLQGVAGGMNAQAQTLGGTISNLGDSFDSLFSAIGERGISPFKSLLSVVKETVDWFTKLIETNPADSYRQQQAELNNLVNGLAIANSEEETRSVLISEIASKYPEFLKFIDAEKSSIDQLRDALAFLNVEYETKIKLQRISEQKKPLETKKNEKINQRAETYEKMNQYFSSEEEFTKFLTLPEAEKQKKISKLLELRNDTEAKRENAQTSGGDTYVPNPKFNTFGTNTRKNVIETQDFENYPEEIAKINKEIEILDDRANAIQKGAINEKKSQLKRQKNILENLKKSGASKDDILTQEKLVQAMEDDINPPKPVILKPASNKNTKKIKDPNKIALDEIDKQMKIEQEQEKQRFQHRKEDLLNNLDSEIIDRNTYSQRLQDAVELNSQNLLKIELKYAFQRPKYLKEAEKEANKTRIDEIKNSFKEYSDVIKKRSEDILKQLIEDQKNIDDEIFKLTADSRLKELKSNSRDKDNKTNNLTKQIKNYHNQVTELDLKLLNPNSTTRENDTKEKEQLEKNINDLGILKNKIVEDSRKKEREINLKYNLQEIEDLEKLALEKLNIYTESEQQRFFKNYQTELDNNGRELLLLRNKISKNEDVENISKRKRLKLEKQYRKDSEELAYRSDLASLIIKKNTFEKLIKEYQKGYDLLTEEEKKGQDKLINTAKSNLGSTQSSIESKVKERKDKKANEKENTSFQNVASAIDEITNAVANAMITVISSLQQAVDAEIAIRERRVDRLKDIAGRGNAELLQLEEKRLQKAQAQKEKYARAEIAINAAQQLSASLLAIANASVAGKGWGTVALVAATIGALTSGFAMVKLLTQDSTGSLGFKDGVIGLNGPGSETSDSIPARLSRGESVITAKGTKAGDNAEILRMMNDGVAFSVPNLKMKDNAIITKQSNNSEFDSLKLEVNSLHNAIMKVNNTIENQKPSSVTIDADGIASISNAVSIRQRKRDKL